MDSFIMIYLAGTVGNFNPAWYGQGKILRYFAVTMFVLAIFFIKVVFMNMLIAIMGQTFSDVQSSKEESGLREQVQLIADHAFLLDLNQVFAGQKYIMIMSPQGSGEEFEDVVIDTVKDSANILIKQINRL